MQAVGWAIERARRNLGAQKVLAHNDLLIQWSKPKRNKASNHSKEEWQALPEQLTLRQIKVLLREAIAATIVLSRPGRSEPRCRKRRQKNFQLMTLPRHEMCVIPHRDRYRAEKA